MRFRFIPPGSYRIGSPESEPGRDSDETRRQVTLTRGFWLGETEITQAHWEALTTKNPAFFWACGEYCPVESVNWFEAVAFANLVSERAGLSSCYELVGCTGTVGAGDYNCKSVHSLDCRGYRLPTEAEWEVAARAGTETALHTGGLTLRGAYDAPELNEIAWYGGNSGVTYSGGDDCTQWPETQFPAARCGTHPVGGKQPNPWGLYDMLGNVWEWVGDRDLPEGTDRALRGGSWNSEPQRVRSASRDWITAPARYGNVGFRLAQDHGQ